MSKKKKHEALGLARNERSECSAKPSASFGSNDSGRVATDVRKRRIDLAFKKEVLDNINSLTRGEKGLYLRKMGLYASQVSLWRSEMKNKSSKKTPILDEEYIAQLKKQNEKLQKRNETLMGLIELQKKMAEILEEESLIEQTKKDLK